MSSVKYSKAGISDYSEALAVFRDFHDNRNHIQAGDPAKLASVVLHLVQVEKPPVSFVAGSDAVDWATSAIIKNRTNSMSGVIFLSAPMARGKNNQDLYIFVQ